MSAAHVNPLNLGNNERTDEQLDPELLELPAPPKRERTLTVGMLLFTAVASLAMVVAHNAVPAIAGSHDSRRRAHLVYRAGAVAALGTSVLLLAATAGVVWGLLA